MPDQPSILFYRSSQPGAQPFVRVPATPEGLRYAGYFARYRGLKILGLRAVDPDADLAAALARALNAGFCNYPKQPPIPLGTERWIVDIDGDSAWSTFTGAPAVGDIMAPSGWTPVQGGAPPPRP